MIQCTLSKTSQHSQKFQEKSTVSFRNIHENGFFDKFFFSDFTYPTILDNKKSENRKEKIGRTQTQKTKPKNRNTPSLAHGVLGKS